MFKKPGGRASHVKQEGTSWWGLVRTEGGEPLTGNLHMVIFREVFLVEMSDTYNYFPGAIFVRTWMDYHSRQC